MSILQNCPFDFSRISVFSVGLYFFIPFFFFTVELYELFMYIFEKLSPHHSQCFHVFMAFTRLSFSLGNGFLLWLNGYMINYISLSFFINFGGISKKLARIYIREYFACFLLWFNDVITYFYVFKTFWIYFSLFWSMCYIFITYMYLSIFLSATCRRHCLFLCWMYLPWSSN